jgi:predicted permease
MRVEIDAAPSDASARLGRLVDRLATLPGATHAAAANLLPLRDVSLRAAILGDGLPPPPAKPPAVLMGGITSDFFAVLDVPIVQGRTFTAQEDRARSPVAVINRTMARRLWPDGGSIGRRFRMAADPEDRWFTIVGISGDILTWDLSNRPQPTAYVPYAHLPGREPRLFVRAAGDPALLIQPARAAIHAIDPGMPIVGMQTMTDIHHDALSRQQTLASLLTVLGGIALLLGAAGVYGVLAYFVSLRTQEIGIRAALGADRSRLVRFFVRQGLTVTLVGIGVGLAGAWALSRVVRGRLHEVSPTDPVSFAGAAALLLVVGLLASYLPARRAAAVDPLTAIRSS